MSIRRGWAVCRTATLGKFDVDASILDVVRVVVGPGAERRARSVLKDQRGGPYSLRPVVVEEAGHRSRRVDSVRRLPMGQSFDDLEIVASSCVMGTLTSIRVQTPDGVVYRTPLTSSLRSELNRLRSVKGTRLRAVSHGYKRVIHEFEITRAASSALAQQTEDR